jgi:hypothetical protein
MIRFNSTTDSLQLILAGAITTNQLPVVVGYTDRTKDIEPYITGSSQVNNSNSGTAVTICTAPPTDKIIRDVDFISVQNADTVSATVTIRFNNNGTTYVMVKATLSVGDMLFYDAGGNWEVMTSTGQIKQV